MTLTEFADAHRLKVTKDECGDPIIRGRIFESNIYEYDDGVLGVIFVTDGREAPRTGLWRKFKSNALVAGMTIVQEGDAEGAFTFDPADRKQSKVAIAGVRARAKRVMTPEQARAGAERLAAAREARIMAQNPLNMALFDAVIDEEGHG